MKHPSSLYRVGGSAIVAGSALLVLSNLLRPAAPETLANAVSLDQGMWVLAYWAAAVGAFALLGGWIALSEHFQHTQVEGWGMMGLGGFTLGAIGLMLHAAVNAEAVPRLIDVFLRGGDAEAMAEAAYLSTRALAQGVGNVAWVLLWTGAAFSGVAIAEDAEYPRWLGYAGILFSIGGIASMLPPDTTLIHDLLAAVGFLWTAAVGVLFVRIENSRPARAAASNETRAIAV